MKKSISTVIILHLFIQSFCQATITELPPTNIKLLNVKPVRFEGNNEWFFFEGFNGNHPGCFGLNIGDIDLTRCDMFNFEFAEYYNGNTNIPLYYIKRGDGKYLSLQLGGAAYVDKMTGNNAGYQKWLISLVWAPTHAYNFLLPITTSQQPLVLKVFDHNKKIGFNSIGKIVPGESEFYLGRSAKYTLKPDTN